MAYGDRGARKQTSSLGRQTWPSGMEGSECGKGDDDAATAYPSIDRCCTIDRAVLERSRSASSPARQPPPLLVRWVERM